MPITITATPTVNVVGRTANHFGIGETIRLTAAVVPAPPRTPVFRWEVTSGRDQAHFSSNGNRARIILLGLNGGSMTVRVRNAWDDAEATLTLTIVAPTNWSLGAPTYRYHEAGRAHAAFRAPVQVQNTHNVSFDNVEMREGNARPERTGRYITENVNAGNHHGATFPLAATWVSIRAARANANLQNAASAGYIALAIDRVSSYGWGGPFNQNGTFGWRIPWTYRLQIPVADCVDVDGNAVALPDPGFRQVNNVVVHQETLTGNQMTISKGGQTLTYTAVQAAVGNAVAFNA